MNICLALKNRHGTPKDENIACGPCYPIEKPKDNRNFVDMAHNPFQGSVPKLGDIGVAFALLSRLPLPVKPDYTRGAEAAWAYPIVGAVIGAIGMGLGGAALGMGLPLPVAGLIALGAMIMASGALHEDGLADVADGFWGGWTVEQRLTIMKDSHVGVYGVVALILSLLLRASLIMTLIAQTPLALIAIAALSRVPMVAIMRYMPNPRSDGLSHKVGQTSILSTWIAAAIGLALCATLIGPLEGLAVVLIAGIAAFCLAAIAQAKIGGQTGDVLGASQQITEIAALAACVALLA